MPDPIIDESKFTPEQKLEKLRARYDSICDGMTQLTQTNEKLRNKVAQLTQQSTRDSQNLQAKINEVQMLGDDFNNRIKSSQDEVVRLRKLCEKRGIDPNI
jgi:hypothetical protein